MSELKFSCAGCGQHIQVHAKYAGLQVMCPSCSQPLIVPGAPTPTPAPKATPAPAARSTGASRPAAPPPPVADFTPAGSTSKRGFPAVAMIVGTVVLLGGIAGGVLALKQFRKAPAAPAPAPSASPGAPANATGGASPKPASAPMAAPGMGMPPVGSPAPPTPAAAAFSGPAVWPQWRGPNRDAKSTETGLLKQWPAGGPPLVWKATGCGSGYSSVSVAGGLIFTMGDFGDGSRVVAFDEKTGGKVWSSEVLGQRGGNYDGTKSTPSVDGNRLYALGQFGDFVCLDAATGKEIWRKHLMNDFGGKYSGWNYTESPLVDGDRVIVTPGGSRGAMVALNKNTGGLIWQSRQWTDAPDYVSALVSTIGNRRHYVQLSQQTLVGIDAETGNLFWRIPRAGATAVVPTPVIYNDIIFVTSGYNVGCNAFQIGTAGGRLTTRQLYANRELVNHHGGVVLVDKYVYGHSDRGDWKCLDITNGRVMWKNEGVGKGAVVFADGHLICRGETGSGNVALVEASPQGYREKGRFAQPDRSNKNSWAHPVVANGKLYLRDQDALLCFNLRE